VLRTVKDLALIGMRRHLRAVEKHFSQAETCGQDIKLLFFNSLSMLDPNASGNKIKQIAVKARQDIRLAPPRPVD
jgi:hypothetical protein